MNDFLFIQGAREYLQVEIASIQYVEAERNKVRIVTDSGEYVIRNFIGHIETMLPHNLFCRVHKSFIVSIKRVKKFTNEGAIVEKKLIPIGREYVGALAEKVIVLYDLNTEKKKSRNEVKKLIKNVRPN